jgi:hypothetical protein
MDLIWNDAALLREYAATRYGSVYAYGGGYGSWTRAVKVARRLARLSGRTFEQVCADLSKEQTKMKLLIPTAEIAGLLETDLEGRLEVMADDDLHNSPDYEDAAAVAELLRAQTEFPAMFELSDAEMRQAFITVENALDLAEDDEPAKSTLAAMLQELKIKGYDR